MKSFAILWAFASLCLTTIPALAQSNKPSVGTLGANQMKGGDGLFGKTYSIGSATSPINITIDSAEYSVVRYNADHYPVHVATPDQKFLIIHFRLQNASSHDIYLGGDTIKFSTVGMDDQTRNDCTAARLASAKDSLSNTLKPGQKLPEEVSLACTVPAAGPVPKLILNSGRVGLNEQVVRFYLGKAPNIVKPLPALYADPSDHTGATPLSVIPAKVGVNYAVGKNDWQVTSIAYAAGPIGTTKAPDNNRLLVVTLSITNKTWLPLYMNGFVDAQLVTDDDEKTKDYIMLKGKRDEVYDGRQTDSDEQMLVRIVFFVPNSAKGKTLKMAEVLDNTNTLSRGLQFDLSGVQ